MTKCTKLSYQIRSIPKQSFEIVSSGVFSQKSGRKGLLLSRQSKSHLSVARVDIMNWGKEAGNSLFLMIVTHPSTLKQCWRVTLGFSSTNWRQTCWTWFETCVPRFSSIQQNHKYIANNRDELCRRGSVGTSHHLFGTGHVSKPMYMTYFVGEYMYLSVMAVRNQRLVLFLPMLIISPKFWSNRR